MRRYGSVVAAILVVAGCGDDEAPTALLCSLNYVPCYLHVDLVSDVWEAGTYRFVLRGDAYSAVCVGEVAQEADQMSCTSEAVKAYAVRDEARVPVWQALVRFEFSPREVEITVIKDDVELGSRSFRPRYEETEPNGKGCGICRNATVSLDF